MIVHRTTRGIVNRAKLCYPTTNDLRNCCHFILRKEKGVKGEFEVDCYL